MDAAVDAVLCSAFKMRAQGPVVWKKDEVKRINHIFVHWETQYRKVVEEPSCIRKPDTGQQQRGFL
jgi:hypothetical protein